MPLRSAHLAFALALAPVAAHAQNAGPAARLQAYDDAVIAIMKARLPQPARIARFERLVSDYYDMPTIAQLVVGPAWANSSAADRNAVTSALAHHSALSLANNFKRYGGERFVLDPAVVDRGASQIVRVTIQSGADSTVLLYRMRQAGGAWRIVDVVSGGVSQLAVQRADLAGTVARGGAAAAARRLAQLDAAAR